MAHTLMDVVSFKESNIPACETSGSVYSWSEIQTLFRQLRDWEGSPPPRGCEVYICNIPLNVFENELLPLFQSVGRIYKFRLMMDYNGLNRGFAFVNYAHEKEAIFAVKTLNNHEIRPGHSLHVLVSIDKCHLYLGGLPRDKYKMEILLEMKILTDGVKDVILGPVDEGASRPSNYGFVYVHYASHTAATNARRKLMRSPFYLWRKLIDVQWPTPGEVAKVQNLRFTVPRLHEHLGGRAINGSSASSETSTQM
uniref:RRM domain-containing protein n=1 Tax=Eptatretus burgeri TaxID=7764 RepID=A0A8C4N626_EPTBU